MPSSLDRKSGDDEEDTPYEQTQSSRDNSNSSRSSNNNNNNRHNKQNTRSNRSLIERLQCLPRANDILPKAAPKREAAIFAIGDHQINAGNLDGVQLEHEALWTFSKSLSEFPSRVRSLKQSPKSLASSPTKHQLLSNNSKLLPQLQQKFPSSTCSSTSIKRIPPSLITQNPQAAATIATAAPSSIPFSTNLSELSTLLHKYPLIYQKYSAETYEFFNLVLCNKTNLNNTKTFDFYEDTISSAAVSQNNSVTVTPAAIPSSTTTNQIQKASQVILANTNNPLKIVPEQSQQQQSTISPAPPPTQLSNQIPINTSSSIDPEATTKPQVSKSKSPITFESRFECGNLSMVFERGPQNYVLLMQNDINTNGCTQWFYFRVENKSSKGKVDFEIANFHKPYSLFSQGMKVLVHSTKKRQSPTSSIGWHRACTDIKYLPNSFRRNKRTKYFSATSANNNNNNNNNGSQLQSQSVGGGYSSYYSLHFSYVFEEEDDCVYFAYNYPYSYTRLQEDLFEIITCNRRSLFITRTLLCRTLAANRVDLLTITDPRTNSRLNKQTIVISARVHPGETVSSFMMKGLIESLLEDSTEAHYLRNHFIFKIIPMVNPDGVIHGNYRCSLAGKDLNRQWKKPEKSTFPEIFALKRLILNTKNLVLFCDLHGHSIKKNIFVYGCHDYSKPTACRELPYLLSKIYEPFSFKDCNFNIKSEKQGTARVALWKSLRIPNIFTLESSFCGPSYDDIHFGISDLERMGRALSSAFLIYFDQSTAKSNNDDDDFQESKSTSPDPVIPSKPPTTLEFTRKDLKKELLNSHELLNFGMEDSAGSDSAPSDDELETPAGTLLSKTPPSLQSVAPTPVSSIPPIKLPSDPLSPLKKPIKKLPLKSPSPTPGSDNINSAQQFPQQTGNNTTTTSSESCVIVPPRQYSKIPSSTSILKKFDLSPIASRNIGEYDDSGLSPNNVSPRIFTLNFKLPHQQQMQQLQQLPTTISPKTLTLHLKQISCPLAADQTGTQQVRKYLSPKQSPNLHINSANLSQLQQQQQQQPLLKKKSSLGNPNNNNNTSCAFEEQFKIKMVDLYGIEEIQQNQSQQRKERMNASLQSLKATKGNNNNNNNSMIINNNRSEDTLNDYKQARSEEAIPFTIPEEAYPLGYDDPTPSRFEAQLPQPFTRKARALRIASNDYLPEIEAKYAQIGSATRDNININQNNHRKGSLVQSSSSNNNNSNNNDRNNISLDSSSMSFSNNQSNLNSHRKIQHESSTSQIMAMSKRRSVHSTYQPQPLSFRKFSHQLQDENRFGATSFASSSNSSKESSAKQQQQQMQRQVTPEKVIQAEMMEGTLSRWETESEESQQFLPSSIVPSFTGNISQFNSLNVSLSNGKQLRHQSSVDQSATSLQYDESSPNNNNNNNNACRLRPTIGHKSNSRSNSNKYRSVKAIKQSLNSSSETELQSISHQKGGISSPIKIDNEIIGANNCYDIKLDKPKKKYKPKSITHKTPLLPDLPPAAAATAAIDINRLLPNL